MASGGLGASAVRMMPTAVSTAAMRMTALRPSRSESRAPGNVAQQRAQPHRDGPDGEPLLQRATRLPQRVPDVVQAEADEDRGSHQEQQAGRGHGQERPLPEHIPAERAPGVRR